MMEQPQQMHITPERIRDYLSSDGGLSAHERGHLEGCPQCRWSYRLVATGRVVAPLQARGHQAHLRAGVEEALFDWLTGAASAQVGAALGEQIRTCQPCRNLADEVATSLRQLGLPVDRSVIPSEVPVLLTASLFGSLDELAGEGAMDEAASEPPSTGAAPADGPPAEGGNVIRLADWLSRRRSTWIAAAAVAAAALALLTLDPIRLGLVSDPSTTTNYALVKGAGEGAVASPTLSLRGVVEVQSPERGWIPHTLLPSGDQEPRCPQGGRVRFEVSGRGRGYLSLWRQGPQGDVSLLYAASERSAGAAGGAQTSLSNSSVRLPQVGGRRGAGGAWEEAPTQGWIPLSGMSGSQRFVAILSDQPIPLEEAAARVPAISADPELIDRYVAWVSCSVEAP